MIKAAARTDIVMTDLGISEGAASPVKSATTKRYIQVDVYYVVHENKLNESARYYQRLLTTIQLHVSLLLITLAPGEECEGTCNAFGSVCPSVCPVAYCIQQLLLRMTFFFTHYEVLYPWLCHPLRLFGTGYGRGRKHLFKEYSPLGDRTKYDLVFSIVCECWTYSKKQASKLFKKIDVIKCGDISK